MNISKALKEKNRAVGRINEFQSKIRSNNKFVEGKTPDFNSQDLLLKLQEEWAYLIELKTKIALANVGIADKLIKLAEAKSELTFWGDFATRYAGPATDIGEKNVRLGTEWTVQPEVTHSTIPTKEIEEQKVRVQKLIEDIQDEIDNYNATTQI